MFVCVRVRERDYQKSNKIELKCNERMSIDSLIDSDAGNLLKRQVILMLETIA